MKVELKIDGVTVYQSNDGVMPGFPPPIPGVPNGPVVPPVIPVPQPTEPYIPPPSGSANIVLDEGYWSSNSVVPPATLRFHAQTPVVMTIYRVPPMQPFGYYSVNGQKAAGGINFKFPAGDNVAVLGSDVPMTLSVRIRRGA